MENCLVTKYKAIVNNENLPIYGKALVVVGTGNPQFMFNEDVNVQVLGGSINSQTLIPVEQNHYLTIDSSTIVSDGTYGEGQVGLLIDKYNVITIMSAIRVDAKDLEFSPIGMFAMFGADREIQNAEKLTVHFTKPELFSFNIVNTNVALDVTELGSNGNMTSIKTKGCTNLYGSLNKAGMSPLTDGFSTPNTKNVSLNIETFVGYQRAAGRTTGSLSLEWLGACNCTFNGAAVENQQNNSLSWTATTITLNGTTINA